MLNDAACPVCQGNAPPLDVVDFNKNCQEENGVYLKLSGVAVYYYLCQGCGFCFAPGFSAWTLKEFEANIYNRQYHIVDPDYVKRRPEKKAVNLQNMFKGRETYIRHLDYGGGSGLTTNLLTQAGWDSATWDPFVDQVEPAGIPGGFNLITAYEVFEHVPDVNLLMGRLDNLLADDGIVLFTTLLSDGHVRMNQRLTWWYAAPRNGHISLFSQKSLGMLAEKYHFRFGSFSEVFHVLSREVIPEWAAHLIQQA